MKEAEQDRSRNTDADDAELNIDDAASEIQRGKFQKPGFFGDQSSSSSHESFSSGVSAASAFAGVINFLRDSVVDEREPDQDFRLTKNEFLELEKRAVSIAAYGNTPVDVIEDFLLILCYVNVDSDMKKIADGVQIAELHNPAIYRKPLVILTIPQLQKIAYAASAVEGLVNMFRKYLSMAQNVQSNDGEDIGDILGALGSLIGGLSGIAGATARLKNGSSEDALGHFMSELITGKRIPMSVIAKNPNLQSPSFAGKAFFGESPTALTNIDIDQLFSKKIASFPKPSNGAGTTSFGLQNISAFAGSMSVSSIAAKIFTGSADIVADSKKSRQIGAITDQISTLTGANASDIVDVRRADTAIPMMQALSAIQSGTEKSLFSIDTFAKGWTLANSVSNHLQSVVPSFAESIKKFL